MTHWHWHHDDRKQLKSASVSESLSCLGPESILSQHSGHWARAVGTRAYFDGTVEAAALFVQRSGRDASCDSELPTSLSFSLALAALNSD
jgi:hypothetical protein